MSEEIEPEAWAERAAESTALTERQALAYAYRQALNTPRQEAAEAMDCTPSNVDNLHREASEKIEDAGSLVQLVLSLDDRSEYRVAPRTARGHETVR